MLRGNMTRALRNRSKPELASRQAWPTSGDSRSVVVCSVFTPSTAYLLLWLQCMTVVGDTVALLLTREGGGSEQSIVLTQCRGAAIDNSKLLTCDKGNDAGSTYYPAKCAKCKTQLGKVYKCTPSHLDDHRDCFTLDAEALCIYHLDDGPADTVPPNQFGGAIASLHDMISKLQRVVCHLNDRLSTIEQMSGIAPPAIAPSTTVPHKKDELFGEEEKGGADEGESEGGRKRLKRKR